MTPAAPVLPPEIRLLTAFGQEKWRVQTHDLIHRGLSLAINLRMEGVGGWIPYLNAMRQGLARNWKLLKAKVASPPRKNGR